MKKLLMLLLISTLAASLWADSEGESGSMTLGDIMTQAYEEVAGYMASSVRYQSFDSTWVINQANNACRRVAKNLHCVERDTFITMTAAVEFYGLPLDILDGPTGIDRVGSIKAGTGLENRMKAIDPDAVGVNRQSGSGAPQFYIVSGDSIQFIPANNDSDSVHVYYFARANNLDSSSDTSNIENDYQDLIVYETVKALLRGKAPVLGAVGEARMAEIEALRFAEETRLKRLSKSELEVLPK